MAQFVDIETAREFMKETLAKVELNELLQIRHDLSTKSMHFRELIGENGTENLTPANLKLLLRMIFATRRKVNQILNEYSDDQLRQWISELLSPSQPIAERFLYFYNRLEKLPASIRFDLAGELLHFSNPEKYWLWTRWIWDPHTSTGALPLVVTDDYKIEAPDVGQMYLKVGEIITFLEHVGRAAELELFDQGPFGVDTYLSCVYVVYVYTVLRLRMTQEFNKVMPGLLEFSRRLLGIYRMEEQKHAS